MNVKYIILLLFLGIIVPNLALAASVTVPSNI